MRDVVIPEFPLRTWPVLVECLCCQAEWVTCRVEKDSPLLRISLLCRDPSTQSHGVRLRCVKVVDFQVQMHLFRHGRVRPRGRFVVFHLDGNQPIAIRLDSVELVVAMSDFAAQERRPEVREDGRVRAVQRRQTQSRRRHSSKPTRHPWADIGRATV